MPTDANSATAATKPTTFPCIVVSPQLDGVQRDPQRVKGGSYFSFYDCRMRRNHNGLACQELLTRTTSSGASYRLWLAGVLGLKGDLNDATAAIAEARKLSPEVDTIERFRASTPYAADPAYWALREKTVEAGLRRAGFPER
jgi:hypothetical protein